MPSPEAVISTLYGELKSADETICMLCKAVHPQHQCNASQNNTLACQEHESRLQALAFAEALAASLYTEWLKKCMEGAKSDG